MKLKVIGGTAQGGAPNLCVTCWYSVIIEGDNMKQRIMECGQLGRNQRVGFEVKRCSAYKDKRQPTLRDMEELAWVLRTSVGGKKIGFVRSSDLKPFDRYKLSNAE